MRYFNKITMTEVIPGIHDINDNVIELDSEHWFFTSDIPGDKKIVVDANGQLELKNIDDNLSNTDKIETNKLKQQQLINNANKKISILQDIIDLDMRESNEDEQLKLWKKFRILVTRVDTNQLDIEWPKQPE